MKGDRNQNEAGEVGRRSGGEMMLLKSYTVKTMMPPCNPMAETINALAELSEDISEALPYLAATLKGCTYRHDSHTLRFSQGGRVIVLYPHQIAVGNLRDSEEAIQVLNELRNLINSTYENRENIEPCYQRGGDLGFLEVLKLLPGTNCKECGEPTCLAFANKLVKEEVEVIRCTPLFGGAWEEKRQKLVNMLRGAGREVPVSTRVEC